MKQQTACSISLGAILWVAGMLAMAAGIAKPAQAAIINYVIHNNGGFRDSSTEGALSVTGTFTFDTDTVQISNFNVTFTGDSEIAGTYTDVSKPLLFNNNDGSAIQFAKLPDDTLVVIRLVLGGIGDFGPYQIFTSYWLDSNLPHGAWYLLNPTHPWPTIVGTLGEPPTTVPEPSTWAMSLLGLAGVGAVTRIGRRKEYTK